MPEPISGPLSGRTALVTGAARRIGRATALNLAGEGAHVVVHALRSREEVEAVAREIRELGGSASVALGDITDENDVRRFVGDILEARGGIDILVNNAAIRNEQDFADLSFEDWRRVTSVVIDGAFLVTRAAIPGMVERRYGRVVSIGGISAHSGVSQRVHVATAKAALIGFTKAIAAEFGAFGITSNLVVPGKIGGTRSATSGKGGAFPGNPNPLVPHEGIPQHVADIVRAVILNDFVSGQTVHVNGGMYLP